MKSILISIAIRFAIIVAVTLMITGSYVASSMDNTASDNVGVVIIPMMTPMISAMVMGPWAVVEIVLQRFAFGQQGKFIFNVQIISGLITLALLVLSVVLSFFSIVGWVWVSENMPWLLIYF